MKKSIVLALTSLAVALPVHAQWVVYDPTLHTQSILNTAQEIAKYVEMINNQVQQITTLQNQLTSLNHYIDLFGDPSSVKLSTAATLATDLLGAELGQNLNRLISDAKGEDALTYTGSGLYVNIGPAFSTVNGTVPRETNSYRLFAAANQATANYVTVSTNAAAKRVALKAEIGQNLTALQSAKTDSEVQKLATVIAAQSADLNSVDHEVNHSLASALVQDMENRNDERKQQQAIAEQRQAEFRQAITNYSAKFPLLTEPVHFPEVR